MASDLTTSTQEKEYAGPKTKNIEAIDRSDVKGTIDEWWFWNKAEDLNTSSSFYTDDFSTDGDGYVVDFSLNHNSTEAFRE